MASLTAHLHQSEDHGRLAFHPDCPVCRAERLSGTLPVQGVVTRRTQAAVVATLLAASTATPTIAVAQEPDQVSEGTLAPADAGADPALNPDFDPGGDSEDLPFDEPEVPESEPAPDPEAGDPGPLEGEPATDVAVPVADAGDEAAEPVVVTPSPTPTVTPTPTPVAPAVSAPEDGEQSAETVDPDAGPRADKAHGKREPRHRGGDDTQAMSRSRRRSPPHLTSTWRQRRRARSLSRRRRAATRALGAGHGDARRPVSRCPARRVPLVDRARSRRPRCLRRAGGPRGQQALGPQRSAYRNRGS